MDSQLVLLCLSTALFIRWAIGTYPYSGHGKAPMFGDYEAQRHWQEITVNLPATTWYRNTSENDLLYWGLDYPPLTAYHSWIVGKIGERLNASWVALGESRGTESAEHKLFMRYSVGKELTDERGCVTVLLSDLAVYFPACLLFCFHGNRKNVKLEWTTLLSLCLYPGLSLIDYGHFQYNSVSLGFFVLAVALLRRDHLVLGSCSFCLALNYKQMELYHALPFFFYILGHLLHKREPFFYRFCRLVAVGVAVITSFALCWLPFLQTPEDALAVFERLFPFSRGVFEDKVSNFWCTLNVVYKIRNVVDQPTIVKLSAVLTLLSVIPSSLALLWRPSIKSFKYSLVVSSLGFFLFSYQVHEKTILVPVISAMLLMAEEPFVVTWFAVISVFSMLPLLIKDGLLVATVATSAAFTVFMTVCLDARAVALWKKAMVALSLAGASVLTACTCLVQPPSRLPDLWPVLISAFSFGHFALYYLYFNYQQLRC